MKSKHRKYYRKDGSIKKQVWHLNDKRHRTDGPAYIYYREDGSVESEHWYLNSQYHRADGPAVIYYREGGSVEVEYWYLNDEYIDPEQHLTQVPKTEEEKMELINEIVFIKEDDDYILIIEWLKRDKDFYEKYRVLIE